MALRLMKSLSTLSRTSIWGSRINFFSVGGVHMSDKDMIDLPDDSAIKLPIPTYPERTDEPEHLRRARLLYQSRKRGMLENGLLLSTFAAKYLDSMTTEQLQQYDRLINLPSNDWDIYYWATGVKEIPAEFENEMMNLFIKHVQNKEQTARIRQPDLYSTEPTVDLYSSMKKS